MTELNEKDDKELIEGWYKQAKEQTIASLGDFVGSMMNQQHDYGTVCHAIAASTMAGFYAADHHEEQGGITGAQAGMIGGIIVGKLMMIDGPFRIVDYEKLLYPQHEKHFTISLSKSSWEWVQQIAQDAWDESANGAPSVRAHWDSIIRGEVPFGLTVKDDE